MRRAMLGACLSAFSLFTAQPLRLAAQTAADSAGIRQAALDYIEGFYSGDGARMERALHPDLAKRIVQVDPATGRTTLHNMSAMTLVLGTREMARHPVPPEARRADVTILGVFGNAASVRVDASEWVDFLHLGKFGSEWRIVNVLWEMRPPPEGD
jgi:hypothetical protein